VKWLTNYLSQDCFRSAAEVHHRVRAKTRRKMKSFEDRRISWSQLCTYELTTRRSESHKGPA